VYEKYNLLQRIKNVEATKISFIGFNMIRELGKKLRFSHNTYLIPFTELPVKFLAINCIPLFL